MEFTEQEFKKAISDGIFDESNNVIASPSAVVRYFEKWAELKAKEQARDLRHKAAELCNEYGYDEISRKIMNF